MSDAYDLVLRRLAHKVWRSLTPASTSDSTTTLPSASKNQLHEGIYAFVAGPSYETRAECRFLRTLGADLVGMSTVPEIIVARHCGLRVLALSLVTNKCILEAPVPGNDPLVQTLPIEDLHELMRKGGANHEEVLEAGRNAAETMQRFVKEVVEGMGREG
jgi:purine-nucleoside phosphorylase